MCAKPESVGCFCAPLTLCKTGLVCFLLRCREAHLVAALDACWMHSCNTQYLCRTIFAILCFQCCNLLRCCQLCRLHLVCNCCRVLCRCPVVLQSCDVLLAVVCTGCKAARKALLHLARIYTGCKIPSGSGISLQLSPLINQPLLPLQ